MDEGGWKSWEIESAECVGCCTMDGAPGRKEENGCRMRIESLRWWEAERLDDRYGLRVRADDLDDINSGSKGRLGRVYVLHDILL